MTNERKVLFLTSLDGNGDRLGMLYHPECLTDYPLLVIAAMQSDRTLLYEGAFTEPESRMDLRAGNVLDVRKGARCIRCLGTLEDAPVTHETGGIVWLEKGTEL